MAGTEADDPHGHENVAATDIAVALWSCMATARVTSDLASAGVPVMVLKGPPLQQRLFGSESAYRSADVDLLVPGHLGRRARSVLVAEGWRLRADNGVLWRIDRAVALERRGVVVDLHWGIHLGVAPPWTLGPLERALWSGASRTGSGWWEPRPEALLVYLALHAAAFDFTKPAGLLLVKAAADLVVDWSQVEALSRRLGAWPAVEHAVGRAQGEAPQEAPALLTGVKGRLVLTSSRLARLTLPPAPARRAVRAFRDRHRA